mmetsp:Transcript_62068/g.116062  ORF Transcript_62068/g.116062 Transcript_62068/m.116062 type:complete len:351 (+) Transcript_62068:69-1121(+)
MKLAPGSLFNYISVCGNLNPLETVIVYLLGLGVWVAPPSLQGLFWTNALVQLAIFIPFVQIPAGLTGHMLYVDIGWPSGLVAIGVISLKGSGDWLRRWLIGGCFILHGGRMALGALVMFGQSSKYTYRFKEDLPRYRYAKYKWSSASGYGMPSSTWWLKMQQDTLGQGFSNATLLCVPAFLCASNPATMQSLEWLGFCMWLGAWLFESLADGQKIQFLSECKSNKTRDTTLGMAPYDKYFLWTWCRHPNYFGEWCAWVGIVVAAASSLTVVPTEYMLARCLYAVALVMIPRLLYDCLVHWTGAGPAEHFSSKKRASYLKYQETVRCFFPFPLPGMDHHLQPGWPSFETSK